MTHPEERLAELGLSVPEVAKPVAAAYCVRATAEASVSTPLAWEELTDELDPRGFTIATVPERLARLGDLWGIGAR